jgi:hypothetical protein
MPECSHVYFDSHFSSARVFYKLNKMNIYFTASVAHNRKCSPKLEDEHKMEFHDAKFFTCDNFTFVQWKSNMLLNYKTLF